AYRRIGSNFSCSGCLRMDPRLREDDQSFLFRDQGAAPSRLSATLTYRLPRGGEGPSGSDVWRCGRSRVDVRVATQSPLLGWILACAHCCQKKSAGAQRDSLPCEAGEG